MKDSPEVVLLNFSLGEIDDFAAMEMLNTDSAEDLFLLVAQAHLPMPHLPDEVTQSMTTTLHTLPITK